MGLESVCIEMSDPFGDDANDFDQVNLAYVSTVYLFVSKKRALPNFLFTIDYI